MKKIQKVVRPISLKAAMRRIKALEAENLKQAKMIERDKGLVVLGARFLLLSRDAWNLAGCGDDAR